MNGDGSRRLLWLRCLRLLAGAVVCFALTGIAFFALLGVYGLTFGQFLALPWMGPVIIAAWLGAWFLVDRLWRAFGRKRKAKTP